MIEEILLDAGLARRIVAIPLRTPVDEVDLVRASLYANAADPAVVCQVVATAIVAAGLGFGFPFDGHIDFVVQPRSASAAWSRARLGRTGERREGEGKDSDSGSCRDE